MAKKNEKKTVEEPEVKQQETAEAQDNAIEELKQEAARLKEQVDKEKADYLRLMAEFETFRRRSAEDRLNLVASAAADTIKGLLPVLDDCERAIKVLQETGDEAALEGTNLIYTKLMGYLKSKGLEVIPAQGEPFDTDLHEAVAQIPAGEEGKGKVVEVAQTGYKFAGKVMRYAKVVVGN
jgi:molecular chaperone GrpE